MGGSSSSKLQDKHVVIVGGGYGGITLANHLKGKCKFTLIDPRETFHHTIGGLRAVVEKGYSNLIFIPYAPTFGESFKQGKAVSVDTTAKKVVLETGDEISYDYLVLATGSSGVFPVKIDLSVTDASEAMEMYNSYVDKIDAAKDIVIIGGGPVGIELAGEIATDKKDKKITIIHSRSALINNGTFNDKFKKRLRKGLQAKGVEILFEQKVSNLAELPPDGSARCTVKTDKGSEVEADLVFACIGLKTNSSAYSEAFSDKLDEIGCLKVDEFLRVEGYTDVFAIGDCSAADGEAKLAFKASVHAEVVAQNLQLHEDGKHLKTYKPPINMIVVPLGRNGGVAQMGNSIVVGNMITKIVKSKHLFTSRYWGDMGQEMPTNVK
ncbi:ferroptosis suppressor protein 1-like [Amphiura filiformis]|uniref:ferroptosis suppressor protein 1-like n=1 Tax=Amphiura filiformis TaxID=82378 RepID=UPI003B2212F3